MVKIRCFKESDILNFRELARNEIANYHYLPESARLEEDRRYFVAELAEQLKQPLPSIFVAEEDKKLIGALVFKKDVGGVKWIEWLFVHHDHRKQGVATRLLNSFIELCTVCGDKTILCDVVSTNIISQDFLKSNDFKSIGMIEKAWYGLDFYLMQRCL